MISISEKGIITIQDIDKSLNYKVFVSVYNSFVWIPIQNYWQDKLFVGDEVKGRWPLVHVETIYKYTPPFIPRFEKTPPTYVYDIETKKEDDEEEQMVLPLPDIMSLGAQIVKIEVLNYKK